MIIRVPSWLVIWNLLLACSGVLYDGVTWDLSALDPSFSILSPESHLSLLATFPFFVCSGLLQPTSLQVLGPRK